MEQTREELIKSKFVAIQELLFSSGFTLGEISDIITSLQKGISGMVINIPKAEGEQKTFVCPVEPAVLNATGQEVKPQ